MKIKAIAVLITGGMTCALASAQSLPNLFPLPNGSGFLETYNINKTSINLTGAFFQSLGANGRSCSSCHRPLEGWSVSANEIKLRFLLTGGTDPIFRTNDVPTATTTSTRRRSMGGVTPTACYSTRA